MVQYAYQFANVDTLFLNVSDFIAKKKASIDNYDLKEEIKYLENQIKTAKLVVWDDIGIKSLTEFEKEYLYILLNNRINNMQSNIYTSNIVPEELTNYLGNRLASRVTGNEVLKAQFCSKDRR